MTLRRAGGGLLFVAHRPQPTNDPWTEARLRFVQEYDFAVGVVQLRFDAVQIVAPILEPSDPKLRISNGELVSDFDGLVRRAFVDEHNFKTLRQIGENVEYMLQIVNQSQFGIANGKNDAEIAIHQEPLSE
jgi:hypothetical protein